MKTRRMKLMLSASTVALSLALAGCGGGGGPQSNLALYTPPDKTDGANDNPVNTGGSPQSNNDGNTASNNDNPVNTGGSPQSNNDGNTASNNDNPVNTGGSPQSNNDGNTASNNDNPVNTGGSPQSNNDGNTASNNNDNPVNTGGSPQSNNDGNTASNNDNPVNTGGSPQSNNDGNTASNNNDNNNIGVSPSDDGPSRAQTDTPVDNSPAARAKRAAEAAQGKIDQTAQGPLTDFFQGRTLSKAMGVSRNIGAGDAVRAVSTIEREIAAVRLRRDNQLETCATNRMRRGKAAARNGGRA